jgi:DNA-binding response OmpR family regulator
MSAATILCVDDDRDVLKMLETVLLHHGFDVTAVASVPEALELISRRSFDILLTDLNVGEPGDGFTVVSAMRRVQPNACTFILTGYPDIESAIQAIRSQVDDYFTKPLNIDHLLEAISSVRNNRRPEPRLAKPIRVSELIRRNKTQLCDQWLKQVLQAPELAENPLSDDERINDFPALIDELVARIENPSQTLSEEAQHAARAHGKARYNQGYTIPHILLETRILQQVLSETVQRELLGLDLSSLVPDSFQIGESLQSALEVSVRSYQAQIPHSLQTSFSVLYKSPHLGVAIADENRILDANDALLHMIQRTRDELRAGEIDWPSMTPEKFEPADVNAIQQLREFGVCAPFEKEFVLPDGSVRPFLIGAVRLRGDPLEWSAYIVDLTQQRRLYAAEKKVTEWQSRNALISRLAHEINNPLAALMFTLYLLGTLPDLSSDGRDLLSSASEMLHRIDDSVKQVLLESRPV